MDYLAPPFCESQTYHAEQAVRGSLMDVGMQQIQMWHSAFIWRDKKSLSGVIFR